MPLTKRIGMWVLSVAALLATASTAAAGFAADMSNEEESANAFGQDELLSGDEEEFQEHGERFDENGEGFHENGDGFDAGKGGDELTDDSGLDREGVLSTNLEVLRCVDENTVLVKKTEILTMPLSDLAGHENGFATDEHALGEDESGEDLLGSHGENGQMWSDMEENGHMWSDMEIVRCVGEDTLLVRTTSLVPTTVLREETMLETVQLDELMHGEDDRGAFGSSFRQVDSLENPFLHE